ncbi:unnamed protein product [Rangifer tarandus platyrhynchus]|uniref:Uncharacterized protein n=2 Tax=Rangifer tarandus platyrhynchus TaxID=3082113 RepID=A0ACB0F8X2_RANTA|nr:unnamed protein product [Rangifer tarandus platyrhynchus]CAI9709252.1 unnamed protein product [Rangifer tarandus platyrhynchus]
MVQREQLHTSADPSSSPPRSQPGSSIPAFAVPPPGPRLLRPREAGLCPRPAFPRPPGGGGPWRARSLAAARARAGTRSADWLAWLGGVQEPGESLGEAGQRPGAAGAQGADRSSRSPADRSPHVGAEAWSGSDSFSSQAARVLLAIASARLDIRSGTLLSPASEHVLPAGHLQDAPDAGPAPRP